MRVEIDSRSGFCFGVVRAITEAERALESGAQMHSLGDIVHNRIEVQRLESLGLKVASLDNIEVARGGRILIRAHGEPPATYRRARELGIEIIDATCPVVAKLQQRVIAAHKKMSLIGGQVVLLGKRGHAEVVGLTGQVEDKVIVVEREEDLELVDFSRPIYLLSQTTQSIALFEHLADIMRSRSDMVEVSDTICRQVSSREAHLEAFVRRFDVVIFVCGKKSSNGKVLFEVCLRAKGERCYNIEEASEICPEWLEGAESVGICGATSTPAWLMERVANYISSVKQLLPYF
ncbi:MAG: 4-hydroxy-3-methylbut-2-enyl diphosphate reductase [Rikenellaceae bacterium]